MQFRPRQDIRQVRSLGGQGVLFLVSLVLEEEVLTGLDRQPLVM